MSFAKSIRSLSLSALCNFQLGCEESVVERLKLICRKLKEPNPNYEELEKLYLLDIECLNKEVEYYKELIMLHEEQFAEFPYNGKSPAQQSKKNQKPNEKNKKNDESQGSDNKNKAKTQPQKDNEEKKSKKNANQKSAASEDKKKAKPAQKSKPIDLSRLSILVGKIVEVNKHPDADKLYVEKVDFGNSNTRTIISGLVNHVSIENMMNRIALFVTNLKPVKMRGIASEGMILCASTPEKVEILNVPKSCKIGDRVSIDGFFSEADSIINPKEKVLEALLPLLKVNSEGHATFDGKPFVLNDPTFTDKFTADTLRDCPVK